MCVCVQHRENRVLSGSLPEKLNLFLKPMPSRQIIDHRLKAYPQDRLQVVNGFFIFFLIFMCLLKLQEKQYRLNTTIGTTTTTNSFSVKYIDLQHQVHLLPHICIHNTMYIYSHKYVSITLCTLIVTYVYSQHYARSLSHICILNTMYISCHIILYASTTQCTLSHVSIHNTMYISCHILYASTTLCTLSHVSIHNTLYFHSHIYVSITPYTFIVT